MLAVGMYTLEATATDAATNVGPTTTLNFEVMAPTMPEVAITYPTMGAELTDPVVTFAGTATDLTDVEIHIDGELSGTATVEMGEWSYSTGTALEVGDHTVEALSVDGLVTSGVAQFSITALDTSSLVITSPTEGEILEMGAIAIKGTGAPGSDVTVTFEREIGDSSGRGACRFGQCFCVEGYCPPAAIVVNTEGQWEIEFEDVIPGDYTIEASDAEDTSTSISVTVTESIPTGDDTEGGEDEGCGCGSTGPINSPSALFVLFGLIALRIRSRRRA